MNLFDGPWGGGNQFGKSLTKYLTEHGHLVIDHLNDNDIDIILLTDPRKELQSCAFNHIDINRYKKKNPNSIIIHRVNECDERKGTFGVNKKIIEANKCADYTVFVSSWLAELFFHHGIQSKKHSVILNGSDSLVFNNLGYQIWKKEGPLRIVTHHWGSGWLKGFDIYMVLDRLLGDPKYAERFQFTFIGNLPEGFLFTNSRYVSPLSGIALGNKIKENHIYLTASINEPGGNHQNEGALCGLPLLYRDSGCMPEYCDGFGIIFNENFLEKLEEVYDRYCEYVNIMHNYPHTAERTNGEYLQLFNQLMASRSDIIASRRNTNFLNRLLNFN